MFQIIMPCPDICYDISLRFFNHCCGKTPEETTYGKKGIAQSVRASAITGVCVCVCTRVHDSRSLGQEAGRASSELQTNINSTPVTISSSWCHLLRTLQPSKWCHKLGVERSKHEPMGAVQIQIPRASYFSLMLCLLVFVLSIELRASRMC